MRRLACLGLPALLLSLAVAAPARAEPPTPGKVVIVTCEGDLEQRYACYLPRAYTPDRSWPILYCFSPNANGDAFVQTYRDVCEEKGWIVVGSMNARNGPWEPIQAAIDAMWADTAKRFSLSDTMRYASGFSGGARVSFALAEMKSTRVAGVIAIGAGMHEPTAMPRDGLVVFLTCGDSDPNKRELDPLSKRLDEKGFLYQYETFAGGHEMAPKPVLEKAVRWMDAQALERKEAAYRSGLDLVRQAQASGDLVMAWRGVTKLQGEYPEVKGDLHREAEALRKELEKDPAVKVEVKAQRELDKALEWIEKNQVRIERFESPRKQAVEKLQRVVDAYGGTRAATVAKETLDRAGYLQKD